MRTLFSKFTGWRLKLLMLPFVTAIGSLTACLVLAVEGWLGMAPHAAPSFFWIAGGVAALSALAMVALARRVLILVNVAGIAASLTLLAESLRVRGLSQDQSLAIHAGGRIASVVLIALGISLLLPSLGTLFVRRPGSPRR